MSPWTCAVVRRRFCTGMPRLLSADNHRTLLIPEGFAHGFQTLTDDCEMLYFHTAAYQPAAEGGLNAQDPRLGHSLARCRWPDCRLATPLILTAELNDDSPGSRV